MPPVRPVPSTITSLTDQELADSLRKYGVSLGPILPTTRRVYERKLYQLKTGQQASPATKEPPVDDEDDDDEEDEAGAVADEDSADDEVTLQHQPRQRTTRTTRTEYSARGEVRKPSPRKPLHSGISQTTSPLYASPGERRSKSASSQRKAEESSRGLPWWVKLLAILIIAVIVFLVIKNMEPNPASSIPDQIEVNV